MTVNQASSPENVNPETMKATGYNYPRSRITRAELCAAAGVEDDNTIRMLWFFHVAQASLQHACDTGQVIPKAEHDAALAGYEAALTAARETKV